MDFYFIFLYNNYSVLVNYLTKYYFTFLVYHFYGVSIILAGNHILLKESIIIKTTKELRINTALLF